jgi:hypothetical protein
MSTAAIPLVLVLALAAPPTGNCQEHAVVSAPQPVTAPLGSNATFYCTVLHAEELKWRINNLDIPLDEESLWEIAARPGNGFFRGEFWSNSTVIEASLLVFASVSNNRSVNISCSAFGGYEHPLESSPNVQLTVFGLPLVPGQLEVIGDTPFQLRLSWSPPFTLRGEIVSYSLLVQDLNTNTNHTLGPLSETSYTHQVSETLALACHLFRFSVFSLNEVGPSINSSSAPPILHPTVPAIVEITRTAVMFTNGLTIELQLEIQEMCSPPAVTLYAELEGEKSVSVSCTVEEISGGSATVAAGECGVRRNEKYSLTLRAENQFGLSSSSESVTVYTTDVQWGSAQELANGSVLLKCGFAEGSRATGCQLTIILSHTGRVRIVLQLHRKNSSLLEVWEFYKGPLAWGLHPFLLVSDIDEDGPEATIELKGDISLLTTTVSSLG